MSKQVIFARNNSVFGTNNNFLCGFFFGTSQVIDETCVVGFTLGTWYYKTDTAPGVGKTITFTVNKNGSPTASVLSITGTNTTATSTGGNVTFAAGDTIRIVESDNSPAFGIGSFAFLITHAVEGSYIYGWSTGTNIVTANWVPLAYGSNQGFGNVFKNSTLIPTAGTISKHRVTIRTAPGSGKSRVYTIRKNGTAQDGTGGTPDTRVTIADANTVAEASFSLTVAAGDQLDCLLTEVSSPAAITWCSGTFIFTPTQSGAFFICNTGQSLNNTTTQFNYPDVNINWGASSLAIIGHPTQDVFFNSIVVEQDVASGGGKSHTYSLEVNGSTKNLSTVNTTVAKTTGTTNATIKVSNGDTFGFKQIPAGTPAGAETRMSLGMNTSAGGPTNKGGGKGHKGDLGGPSQFGPSLYIQLKAFNTYGAS